MDREVMTVKGAELLRDELKMLKSTDRPEIIAAIATARDFGDLKENAEYHAAKEKQSFIEGRISEIESKLSCLLYTSPSPRDRTRSRMPSSA